MDSIHEKEDRNLRLRRKKHNVLLKCCPDNGFPLYCIKNNVQQRILIYTIFFQNLS